MSKIRRCQRIFILSLLSLSVVAPLVFVSHRLNLLTPLGRREFLEELYRAAYRTDTLKLNAVEQEAAEELDEPNQVVYTEKDFVSTIGYDSENNHDSNESRNAGYRGATLEINGFNQHGKEHQGTQQNDLSFTSQGRNIHDSQRLLEKNIEVTTKKVQEIKNQLNLAKAYLKIAPPSSNLRLRDLERLSREMELVVGEATQDSDLSMSEVHSALQKMRHMEASLSKVYRAFPDCSNMAAKLNTMKRQVEEQVRSQRHQATYLVHLAARTAPKGIHCLSMQLTAEYFALRPEERKLPNENNIHRTELYHYAVFSDNVLACAAVVNSTISSAKEQGKLVFHVLTKSLNLPAISMWFLINPPGKATVHVQSIDNFEWLSKDNSFLESNSSDPRYTSELNYLRFYLPDIFPALNRVVLFDHDVVVQQDLSALWNMDMKGNVIGAVGTCQEGKIPFHRIDMFLNFSDPLIGKRFDINACTWAFGMNLFDLQQWRRHNLTAVYHNYLQMGLSSVGSLPLGWLTFYNKTELLNRQWHILGLGYSSDVDRNEIERAAVIHYDGLRKPWLDIAMGRYKSFWTKYVNYDNHFLQRCNLQA
ncbi:probable galacturonosyltransferase 6 isoform X1 [Vigna umbellata]|uniref:probable galacturonosyltransferase 6 isoform X1 n=1 Tax=Vigna umbellata TaxID=87088 RepID=UPI001F5EE73D|nr:probable galacturonosyltransferase 6 isoform X1 [Vigna umbellata]XP_047162762.1 probable galacturonosyltransferase 6 isoform X1 [Vigna umbellata]